MKQFIALFLCAVLSYANGQAKQAIDCNNPPQSDPDKCCQTPSFFTDDMVLKCETSLKTNISSTTADPASADCIASCLLANAGVVGNDGSFKKDALEAFLVKQANDAVWTPLIKKALTTCLADAVTKQADFQKIMKDRPAGSTCQPRHLFTIDCEYMQLFKQCPTTRWSSNANCNNLKEYVNKCSLIQ